MNNSDWEQISALTICRSAAKPFCATAATIIAAVFITTIEGVHEYVTIAAMSFALGSVALLACYLASKLVEDSVFPLFRGMELGLLVSTFWVLSAYAVANFQMGTTLPESFFSDLLWLVCLSVFMLFFISASYAYRFSGK